MSKPRKPKKVFKELAKKEVAEQLWPSDVPMTEENMVLASKSFWLYHEGWGYPLNGDDEKDWVAVTRKKAATRNKVPFRDESRELTKMQANCRRAISLYGIYVVGGEFAMGVDIRDEEKATDQQRKVKDLIDRLCVDTFEHNADWWTPHESAIRAYRDGDAFTRRYEDRFPAEFRFVDPEEIADENGSEYGGVVTDPNDVATVIAYKRFDEETQKVVEVIPAAEMTHIKVNADSSEKRGAPQLESVFLWAKKMTELLRTEVIRRQLQASIVMVRKVEGGAAAARRLRDHAETGTSEYSDGTYSRQKVRPGTIITESAGVETSFAQPDQSDSFPERLFKEMKMQIAVCTGWTYAQISGDASGGNLASELIQESPTHQMVEFERNFLGRKFKRLMKPVIEAAIASGKIPGVDLSTVWEIFELKCRFPNIVTRDALKDAQVITHGIQNGTMSRAEGSRKQGLDPAKMRKELEEEHELGIFMNVAAMQPGMDDKATSSLSNAKSAGSNQGTPGNAKHSDRKGARDGEQ